jgi:N-acyl-D-aspartate/D-glutamate deacylase
MPTRPGSTNLLLLGAMSLLAACASAGLQAPARYDLLIVNGLVYDGTLAEPRHADVAVRADAIAAVGPLDPEAASIVIDASGMIVVPGFIDPHTHALGDLRSDRRLNSNYLTQGVTTVFIGNDGAGVPDRSRVLAELAEHRIGTNVAFFAGHNLIRQSILGGENRAPTPQELEAMRGRVAEEMQAGALGLSTGLYYVPGSYSEFEEVAQLARVAAEFGSIYETHLRDESSYTIGLVRAVDEAMNIGREAGLPVHISHIKALGRDVRGQSATVIRMIESARSEGVDVTANLYPWRASGTNLANALLPRWVLEGSQKDMLARLRDPLQKAAIEQAMQDNLRRRNGPDAILITESGHRFQGKTLTQAAELLRREPVAAAILLIQQGNPSIASFNMSSADIAAFAAEPWVMFASDGTNGHPRKYASYPKAYRDFVIENGLMGLAAYVYKSSGLVAETFGLCDRGRIAPGFKADIAVIDRARFRAVADYANPAVLSPGVKALIVNGTLVIREYETLDNLAGRVIEKNALSCEPER